MIKPISTFDRKMKNAKFKRKFEKSYKDLLFSELMIAVMENNDKSVRKLAKEAQISPSVIQDIRTGKQKDMRVSNFIHIVHALGYEVILERGSERFILNDSHKNISVVPLPAV